MATDDPDDDEDWYDDEDEFDAGETAHCPECGTSVHSISDKCPACGYWLSETDRRDSGFAESRPMWLKVTAVVVLAAFVTSLLAMVIF
jgi:predicted amidophosphoribosyltransferase